MAGEDEKSGSAGEPSQSSGGTSAVEQVRETVARVPQTAWRTGRDVSGRAGDAGRQVYAYGERAVRAAGRQAEGPLVALGLGAALGVAIGWFVFADRRRSPLSADAYRALVPERRVSTREDTLIAWLRDAHAMEAATIRNLERLVGRADDDAPLKQRLQHHLDVSRRQADAVEEQLKKLGADVSILKDMAMRVAGWMEPFLGGFTSDEIPKHCLAAHAWEHFEIASYRSMLGAAEELGMNDLREMCERFIQEEQEMAEFLFDHLPEITRQYLRGRPG